ncbi:MAG TPA: biotin/lipoyl-containing protein, partial [Pyrinomonadaceae bacterium]|nr:biotin/lipoyl-containing protein [Pyrinomonadaceae bacterium]
MSTEVVMPQMGESIAEGTITKWLKKIGERVERDEPLFEISTDKVDAEIPSPAAGTLTEVRFNEGDTVEVNTVVAVLDGNGAAPAAPAAPAQETKAAAPVQEPKPVAPPPPAPEPLAAPRVESKPVETVAQPAVSGPETTDLRAISVTPPTSSPSTAESTAEDLRRTKSSPLVRKIAQEHGVDISRLEGTGLSGRVTKNDILSFIESGSSAQPKAAAPASAPSTPAPMPQEPPIAPPPARPVPGDRVEPMSVMRKKIAEHMTMSRRTSAHVTTVYEIDMTRIAKLRDEYRESFFQRTGTKLTFMP